MCEDFLRPNPNLCEEKASKAQLCASASSERLLYRHIGKARFNQQKTQKEELNQQKCAGLRPVLLESIPAVFRRGWGSKLDQAPFCRTCLTVDI